MLDIISFKQWYARRVLSSIEIVDKLSDNRCGFGAEVSTGSLSLILNLLITINKREKSANYSYTNSFCKASKPILSSVKLYNMAGTIYFNCVLASVAFKALEVITPWRACRPIERYLI